MKKLLFTLLTVVVLSLSLASPVFAAGGQEHGDKAEGPANQHQESGLPDWGD